MSSYIGRVHTSSTTVAHLDSTSTKLLANTIRFYKTQDGHPVWHQRRHRDRSVVDHRHSQYSVKIRADHSIPPHTHTRARASARALPVIMPCATKERLQFTMPPRASVVLRLKQTLAALTWISDLTRDPWTSNINDQPSIAAQAEVHSAKAAS